MKMPRTLMLALALSLFAAPASAEEGVLNISYVKSPFNLPMMVMKDHKILEKKLEPMGIAVKWHDIDSGAQQATLSQPFSDAARCSAARASPARPQLSESS